MTHCTEYIVLAYRYIDSMTSLLLISFVFSKALRSYRKQQTVTSGYGVCQRRYLICNLIGIAGHFSCFWDSKIRL